jgi:DNA-binding HxlR family transcriptional regulator
VKRKRKSIRRRGPKQWRPVKANRQHLEDYVRGVIVRDITTLGGAASAAELRLRFPDRYHAGYLTTTLKAMRKDGLLRHSHYARSGRHVYRLPYDIPNQEVA